MKALFNGTCELCQKFLPGCAMIRIKVREKGMERWKTMIFCAGCREKKHGQYRLDSQHK